ILCIKIVMEDNMKKIRKVVASMTAVFVLSTSIIPAPITIHAESANEIVKDTLSMEGLYQAPEKVERLKDLAIELKVEEADRIKLVYQATEQSLPVTMDMESTDDTFHAVIPESALWSSTISYWFEIEGQNEQQM